MKPLVCGLSLFAASILPASCLLASTFPAHALTAAAPSPAALVGKWTWTRSSNHCTEVYEYRTDGTMFIVSGAEHSKGTYSLSAMPDGNGFHELKARSTWNNGAQDCSDHGPTGDPGGQGAPHTVYVIFHRSEPMLLICQTPALDHCFGPLRRIEP